MLSNQINNLIQECKQGVTKKDILTEHSIPLTKEAEAMYFKQARDFLRTSLAHMILEKEVKYMNNINSSLKQQLENNYVMTDSTLKTVKDLGFRYYKRMNYDNERTYYIYSFPIEKYNNMSIMFCDIIVEVNNGLFSIEVRNFDGKTFAPFYNSEFTYAYKELFAKYENAITNEFTKLGIERR